MVQKLELSGEHFVIDENLRKYVNKKFGRLDRYMPRHSRESAHLEVHMKEHKSKGQKECICSVTMHLPNETVNIKEKTRNMYAAVDILQVKLKQQIQRYKDRHATGKLHRRMFARARGSASA
ncbi:ribosome-associated translation inhibitor RaiA [Candidatus Saccharibacteria bacterium]|nr:ribosome-associated translation inhibitor RaiA [Candidatus Saccharibacteria bacterium]